MSDDPCVPVRTVCTCVGLLMMPHGWNMPSAPQGSGPPASMVMREPPQYSKCRLVIIMH